MLESAKVYYYEYSVTWPNNLFSRYTEISTFLVLSKACQLLQVEHHRTLVLFHFSCFNRMILHVSSKPTDLAYLNAPTISYILLDLLSLFLFFPNFLIINSSYLSSISVFS